MPSRSSIGAKFGSNDVSRSPAPVPCDCSHHCQPAPSHRLLPGREVAGEERLATEEKHMSKKKITEVVVDEDAATTQLDFALLEAAEAALEGIKYTAKDLDITLFPDSYPGRRVSPEEVRVAATVGILQPIDLEEDDKGGYIVRDGHRRIMMAHPLTKFKSRKLRQHRPPGSPSLSLVAVCFKTLILNNT